MTGSSYDSPRAKLADAWRNRAMSLKAFSFALIGVVNTIVDYSVFLLARGPVRWQSQCGFYLRRQPLVPARLFRQDDTRNGTTSWRAFMLRYMLFSSLEPC